MVKFHWLGNFIFYGYFFVITLELLFLSSKFCFASNGSSSLDPTGLGFPFFPIKLYNIPILLLSSLVYNWILLYKNFINFFLQLVLIIVVIPALYVFEQLEGQGKHVKMFCFYLKL